MLPSAVSDSRVHNILPNKIETDFQFSRASSATRVNHQGLIENVGYFSDELVQNGNFSELGSELVTNGDFATDSDWVIPAGWSINNGKAIANFSGGATGRLTQNISFVQNKTYKVVFTISDYEQGNIRIEFRQGGGNTISGDYTGNGTYTLYQVADFNHTQLSIRGLGDAVLKVDNISVKQVDPNDRWSLFNGATITNNKANIIGDGSAFGYIEQTNTFTIGKTYKITLDAVINSGGGLKVNYNLGFASTIGNITTSGSYTFTYTAVVTGSIIIGRLVGGAAYDSSVTNISIVEVQGDKPRLDYDPTNPTCPHLLLEPQSTNEINFSEDFTKWNLLGVTTVEYVSDLVNPDGSVGGYKISGEGIYVNNGSGMTGSPTSTSGRSIYARSVSGTGNVQLLSNNANTNNVFTINETWQRFELNSTPSIFGQSNFYVDLRGASSTLSEVYVFAAQSESIDIVTSYIPTAGAAETRVAETCNNAGNADTFNSTEGVLYAEIQAFNGANTDRQISLSDGTTSNRVGVAFLSNGTQIQFVVVSGGSVTMNTTKTIATITDGTKLAVSYKANDFKIYSNGVLLSTDTSGAVPSGLNEFAFDRGDGAENFYGKVKGLATYNRALTDTELYTITSTQYSAYSGMVTALGNYTIPC